jgi:hypothetical protein
MQCGARRLAGHNGFAIDLIEASAKQQELDRAINNLNVPLSEAQEDTLLQVGSLACHHGGAARDSAFSAATRI